MRKISYYIALMILLSNSIKTYSQDQTKIDSTIIEKVNLFTDRTLYIADEKILFTATLQSNTDEILSKILYVELVDQFGYQIVGEKFNLDDNHCSGFIRIPSDISTDFYYLKSYTKYMRNFGAEIFNYNSIKIINPNEQYFSNIKATTNSNDTNYSFSSAISSNILDVEINKQNFNYRDSVKIKIKYNKQINDTILYSCISVVPVNTSNDQIFESDKLPKIAVQNFYYPETRGISLTGIVKTSNEDSSIISNQINLSIIGKDNDFMSTYVKENGRFFFSLPDIIGNRDLFLCTDKNTNNTTSILIDNDFSPNTISFKKHEFYLTNEEQKAALNLNVNVELSQFFKKKTNVTPDTINQKSIPFYGTPSKILYIDNYIQLPTVEDYFKELSYHVKVRKSHGHKYFKIDGTQSEIDIYPPLVLIDMVAVNNIDEILSIPSQYIQQVDIINIPYVKGDIIYGGIVSLISKNNDFGGINLPNSGTFINYRFLSDSDQETINYADTKIPDTRNTLYWNPFIRFNSNKSKKLSFKTADTPGKYEIIIKGITTNNEIFREVIPFTVK